MELRGPEQTRQAAKVIARLLRPGDVVALKGDLGAGKTCFVQGLAEGLGVADLAQVLSPTYTLMNEYPGAFSVLAHIDLYRLNDLAAAEALGLADEIGDRRAIWAIEWANQLPELIPSDAIWVELSHNSTETRLLIVRGLLKPEFCF